MVVVGRREERRAADSLSRLMANQTAVHTQKAYMITTTMTVMYSSTTYLRSVLNPAVGELC